VWVVVQTQHVRIINVMTLSQAEFQAGSGSVGTPSAAPAGQPSTAASRTAVRKTKWGVTGGHTALSSCCAGVAAGILSDCKTPLPSLVVADQNAIVRSGVQSMSATGAPLDASFHATCFCIAEREAAWARPNAILESAIRQLSAWRALVRCPQF